MFNISISQINSQEKLLGAMDEDFAQVSDFTIGSLSSQDIGQSVKRSSKRKTSQRHV